MFSKSKLKTDGAWFRTNKWLRALRESGTSGTFIQNMKDDPTLTAAVLQMRGVMADTSGITGPQFDAACAAAGLPATTDDQLSQWIDVGFPRFVYMGELHNPRSVRVEPDANYPQPEYLLPNGQPRTNTKDFAVYVPVGVQYFRQAAETIREKLASFREVERRLEDFANVHEDAHINPGGVADATKPV